MTTSDIQNLTASTTVNAGIHSIKKCGQQNASNSSTPSSPLQYLVPVPSPQLNAAIKAIQNTVEQMYRVKVVLEKPKPFKKGSDSNEFHDNNDIEVDSGSDNVDSNRREKMRVLLNQLQLSVMDQLRVLVKPVTWKEYDDSFIQFDTPLRRKLPRRRTEEVEDFVSSSSSSCSSSSSSSEEEEEVFLGSMKIHKGSLNDRNRSSPAVEIVGDEEEDDEEDLLDLDAVSRVQNLRNQVRKSAEHTCSIRSKHMERLDSFIKKEVQSWQTIVSEECKEDQQQKLEDTVANGREEVGIGGTDVDSVGTMQSSIISLLKTIRALDVKLPEQLELLSETLETLDFSIKPKKRTEGGEGVILSGTERAIISRVDTKRRKLNLEEKEDKITFDHKRIVLKPEQRFALFIANE